MSIKQIECPNCGVTGFPGDAFNISAIQGLVEMSCKCGAKLTVPNNINDLKILSANPFSRLSALSNHVEEGQVRLIPGRSQTIEFSRSFEFPSKVYFAPMDYFLNVKEYNLQSDRMTVISSLPEAEEDSALFAENEMAKNGVVVCWTVYGLDNLNTFSPWYFLFYSAVNNMLSGFYKAALLEYAASFEICVETNLHKKLSEKCSGEVADFLLKKHKGIDERLTDLFPLVTQKKFDTTLKNEWKTDVQELRNKVSHGKKIKVERHQSEKAHQSVYQCIRWFEENI